MHRELFRSHTHFYFTAKPPEARRWAAQLLHPFHKHRNQGCKSYVNLPKVTPLVGARARAHIKAPGSLSALSVLPGCSFKLEYRATPRAGPPHGQGHPMGRAIAWKGRRTGQGEMVKQNLPGAQERAQGPVTCNPFLFPTSHWGKGLQFNCPPLTQGNIYSLF